MKAFVGVRLVRFGRRAPALRHGVVRQPRASEEPGVTRLAPTLSATAALAIGLWIAIRKPLIALSARLRIGAFAALCTAGAAALVYALKSQAFALATMPDAFAEQVFGACMSDQTAYASAGACEPTWLRALLFAHPEIPALLLAAAAALLGARLLRRGRSSASLGARVAGWTLLAGAACVPLAYVLLGRQLAQETMRERLELRSRILCFKGRAPRARSGRCEATWIGALRYAMVELREAARDVLDAKPTCGADTSIYRYVVDRESWIWRQRDSLNLDLVLADSTGAGWPPRSPMRERSDVPGLVALRPSVLHEFLRQNARRKTRPGFRSEAEVVTATSRTIDSLHHAAAGAGTDRIRVFWESFHRRFPGASGLYYLSAPGISADGRQALVEFGGMHRDLDGAAFLLLLRCVGSTWQLADTSLIWVS